MARASLLWKLGEKIIGHVNRPHLVISGINEQNFRPFQRGSYSRFIIAEITNIGGKTAENCLAHMLIDGTEEEFKLHWCGESWEYRRDSTIKIDLEPTESRDLDIAFSICGHFTTPPQSEGTSVTLPPIYPDSSSGREGAWVATTFVTENYGPDSPAYLPPGRHKVEIRIILSEGSGFVINFDIISAEDPSELTIDNDSIKYGAIIT